MDNTTPRPRSSCAMAVATETVVGSHVLTIDGYTKTTAALAVGESIQSDRFRVGGLGWFIECYPRGGDEEDADWVSVFLWLDHHGGNHEVKASPKFVLLDRAGEEILSYGSIVPETFSITDGPAAWGTAQFIQRKTLESYLIIQDDDCCRIRCDVAVIKEPPAVPLPPPDLHRRHLGDLLLASEVGRDVTFVVGGEQQFTAHSCVLAARSSTVFMEEVLGTGKESAVVVGSRHVRVDGMAPRVFEALLHFIYTDSLPDELADHSDRIAIVRGLLAEADRYDMARLKLICSDLLLASEVERDVTFVVGGELFTAHRCVLAARSSTVFMAKVLGTGKESAVGGGSRHVRVDGIAPRVFKALLHFVYTDSVPDHGIAGGLLAAADRYGMERLKMICSDMLCSNIDATMALHTLKLANKHGCLKLNQACVKFIRGMLDAFNLEETK